MADEENVFDQIDPNLKQPANDNPFDAIGPEVAPGSSATGAFTRSAARSALPAVGGLAGAGAGAEAGAAAGALAGPWGAAAGALIGGVAGGLGASFATDKAQDYALSKAPDDWKEAIGQSDRQQRLDQEQHPYASFLGGLAPYALTMRPGGLAGEALPPNATGLQRIMANPVTARVFGGAMTGGMELGQEEASGQPPDWAKVGIATGFGLVFNRPTRLGEAIEGSGARPFRGAAPAPAPPLVEREAPFPQHDFSEFEGLYNESVRPPVLRPEVIGGAAPHPTNPSLGLRGPDVTDDTFLGMQESGEPEHRDELFPSFDFGPFADMFRANESFPHNDEDILGLMAPTIAQAGDLGVMGPGLSEDTFLGREAANPTVKGTAADAARAEQSIFGKPFVDVDATARRMSPELFGSYDALNAQRDAFRAQIDRLTNPPDEDVAAAQVRANGAQTQLEALTQDRSGYAGGTEARRLRAQIRSANADVDDLMARRRAHEAGEGQDSPEVAGLRKQFQDVDFQLRDLSRDVAAARRRAAEAVGGETVAPQPIPPERVATPPEPEAVAAEAPAVAPAVAPAPEAQPESVKVKRGAKKTESPAPAAPEAVVMPAAAQEPVPGAAAAPEPVEAAAPLAARTIEQQRGFIEDDVRRNLIAAGRPADEAEASAKLTSALYETHAERLGDATGTAEEIYRRDGPAIRAGRAQNSRGKLRITDGRNVMTLMRDANASTYVHEVGHDWLERVMRDAVNPAATPQLTADAAAIRKWLGVAEGEKVPTRAHEKFARGFEQYLREGIAPSRRLAGVFGKFRDWLVEIYRTIKGLGEPINEDIRGVFDRMLAAEPQRTVISSEQLGGPTLDEIHAADARFTEPAEAEAAADRVAAERTRHIEEPPPEIAHEIASAVAEVESEGAFETAASADGAEPAGRTEPAGEARRSSGGLSEVERGGGQAGAEPGGVSMGAGGGAEREGGGGSSSNGRELPSGGAKSERASGPQSHPLAGAPTEQFAPADDRIVDRAGNIRIDNLTNVEDIAQAIRDSAERNNDFQSVCGSVTRGQMNDLADDMGLDASKVTEGALARLLGGTSDLAPRILAARKLVVDSARGVADLMAKAADSDDPKVLASFAEGVARHDMIQSALAGVTAEWGRAGSAFRSLMGGWDKAADIGRLLKENTGRDLYQLKLMAKLGKNLDTPAKVSKFLRDYQKRSGGRMLLEYFVNSLISGIATHTTYLVGNEVLLLNKMALETPTAAMIGKMREMMGRDGERMFAGETGAGLAEHIRALPKAWQAAIEALKTGQTTLLPGEEARPMTPFDNDQLPSPLRIAQTIANADVTWREASADTFGLFRGMKDGLLAAAALAKSGEAGAPLIGLKYSQHGQIPGIAIRGAEVLPIGSAVRLPSRGVAAIHSFFRTLNYSIDNNSTAWRQATREGLSGTAHEARVAELRQNPSEASMEQSRGSATNLTLMGQGGELVNRVSRVTNWAPNLPILGETPVLKFIDPFVHIAANIIDQSIAHRTPLGLLSSEIRADVLGRNGNVAQDMAQARMLVGTVTALTFGGLAAQGYMIGSGPSDPNKAAVWRMAGNQAHSIRIGDMWYDVHRLGPLGMLSGIAADMFDVAHAASKGDMLMAGSMLMHALTQNVLDESFMRGPAEWIQAIDDPGRYGERVISSFAASFVPFSVGLSQMDRATDPYTRQTRTVMDAIKQKIPGLSETLMPRRDIWGEPLPNHEALVSSGLTAIYESRMSQDPVNVALAAMGIGIAPVPKSIRNVKLDDQQYDDFARLAGRMAKQRLDAIVRSPDWRMWPSHTQRDVVTEVVKQSREAARGVVMMRYPSIPAEAAKNKQAKEED